jgi:hypothetical protein
MDITQNYREVVKTIKEAILRSQYRAAASVNKEQLSLYYGIGRYVSENSREGFLGKRGYRTDIFYVAERITWFKGIFY